MDTLSRKRKAGPDQSAAASNKKAKGKKQWSTVRKDAVEPRGIQPGDVGIWATCSRNKEAKSVADLRDLFEKYAEKLYKATAAGDPAAAESGEDDDEVDIEAEIQKELKDINQPSVEPTFTNVKLDTVCLIFFKTRAPVEPVSFVDAICTDAMNGVARKGCRFVKRLTPIEATGKASEKGIEEVAHAVVAPHFHGPDKAGKKYAIRTSFRNNKNFRRDDVINRVARVVGPGHKVDLKNYDLLILVEIYQNICGMSVVGPNYDRLKRYNLEELYDGADTGEKALAQSE